jgi:hypothetical protein
MMDGDVSHSSDLKVLTLGVEVATEAACAIVFLIRLLHCYVYKRSVDFSFSFLFFFFSFLTSGASSPEWLKPTAEGGGLLGIFVSSYLRCFCDFTFLLYFRFLFCPHRHYG